MRETAQAVSWQSTSINNPNANFVSLREPKGSKQSSNGEAVYKIKHCLNFTRLLRRYAPRNDKKVSLRETAQAVSWQSTTLKFKVSVFANLPQRILNS
ncbi:hypothetical protein OFN73_05540 [Campylobacter sp. JMF_14 EL1]|nr:hypothetical protein [Campylobacter sp. JMF_14 EL1]